MKLLIIIFVLVHKDAYKTFNIHQICILPWISMSKRRLICIFNFCIFNFNVSLLMLVKIQIWNFYQQCINFLHVWQQQKSQNFTTSLIDYSALSLTLPISTARTKDLFLQWK